MSEICECLTRTAEELSRVLKTCGLSAREDGDDDIMIVILTMMMLTKDDDGDDHDEY